MAEPRSARYQRHDLIDWFSQDDVAAARIAVIGAGAVGNEVVKNLALLGTGRIDVFDFDLVELHNLTRSVFLREADVGSNKAESVAARASDIDPNVRVHGVPGDFWSTLGLAALARYDCAIAAVDNFEARVRLNQLCLIARVDLVSAAMDSRSVTVETFPFSRAETCACYECHLPETAYARIASRYSCGGLKRRAVLERRIPTTAVTASVAGALAASAALRLGARPVAAAQRTFVDTIAGRADTVSIERREGCPGCGTFSVAPMLVRTRNRWHPSPAKAAGDETAADEVLRLSDALVTRYECARCGELDEAARFLNCRAGDFDDSIATCPRCGNLSVSIETRDTFTLAELVERFDGAAVPAKFALATLRGRTVCFDLEEDFTS